MENLFLIIGKIVEINNKISLHQRSKYILVKQSCFYKIIIKKIEKQVIQLDIIWNTGVLGKIIFRSKFIEMNVILTLLEKELKLSEYQTVFMHRN